MRGPAHAERACVVFAICRIVQGGEDMVAQVFYPDAVTVEIALRCGREIGAANAVAPVTTPAQIVIEKPNREKMGSPESILPIRKVMNAGAVCEVGLNLPFAGSNPHIPLEHMRPVVGALLVEQLRVLLPI